jgi:RND family efflux transporter MFP subunit
MPSQNTLRSDSVVTAVTLIDREARRPPRPPHPPLSGLATLVDPVFRLVPETGAVRVPPRRNWVRTSSLRVLLVLLAVVAGAAAGAALGLHLGRVRPWTPAGSAPATATAQSNVPAGHIRAAGRIEAMQQLHIRSRLAGRVAEVPVQEGQFIRAGDVLLRLERQDQEHQVERAVAEVQQRRADVRLADPRRRTPDTTTSDGLAVPADSGTTDRGLALARSRLKAAQAAHRTALELLRQSTVVAPFDGWILARLVHPGETVAVGDSQPPLLVLAQAGALAVSLDLAPGDFARVDLGQQTNIHLALLNHPDLHGRVVSAATSSVRAADGSERFPVKVLLDPEQDLSRVVPGMLVDVDLLAGGS